MDYLSICSGIEAATVAWHPLGFNPVAFSEIEPFPSAVLATHYPRVPNLGDMTKFHEWPDFNIDLLAGGTPCQAFSVAGLRQGLADPRGNLTLTFLAMAARYMPRWIVWENVPGVLSDRTNAFGQLLAGLAQLGYGWAYRVLDAQYFGLAQRRKRVFVVAYLGDWRRAAEVLFESESMRGDNPPSRSARQEVAGTLSARAQGGGGLGTDFDLSGGLQPGNRSRVLAAACAHSLCAHAAKGGDPTTDNYIAHSLRAEGFDASEDGTGRGTPLVPCYPILEAGARTGKSTTDLRAGIGIGGESDPMFTLQAGKQHAVAFSCKDHGADAGEIAPTMRSMGHSKSHANGGGQIAVAFHPTQDPIFSEDGTTHALACGSSGGQASIAVSLNMSVRRLTPRECERLQGFPDLYTDIVFKKKPAADGPRYKALGNSMAVPCMRWIGKRIKAIDEIYAEVEV